MQCAVASIHLLFLMNTGLVQTLEKRNKPKVLAHINHNHNIQPSAFGELPCWCSGAALLVHTSGKTWHLHLNQSFAVKIGSTEKEDFQKHDILFGCSGAGCTPPPSIDQCAVWCMRDPL